MITTCKFIGISREIKKDGSIKSCCSWIISSDRLSEKDAYNDALTWSGKTGDFFRFPDTNGDNCIFDLTSKVHEIKIKTFENNFTFQIDFINKVELTLTSIPETEEQEAIFDPQNPENIVLISEKKEFFTDTFNLQKNIFIYEYYGNFALLPIPQTGENITIDDKNYFCESIKISQDGLYHFTLQITAIATNTDAKLVSEKVDNEKRSKIMKYFVNPANINDFKNSFKLNETSVIAGGNYYLQSISHNDNNETGTFFELYFRKIQTEILEYSREEYMSHFIDGIQHNPEVIFKSSWQVHAKDLSQFQNIIGNSAESWAEENSIITKVIPKKISEIEYLIKLEAQLLTNPSLYKSYSNESHYSLRGRIDYKLQWVDFKLTPLQCGYIITQDSSFFPIENWSGLDQCPFETTTILPINLINSISKLVQITEISYIRGTIKQNVKPLIEWHQPRVLLEKIANFYGSYLKTDLKTAEVFDNNGKKWTQITKTFLLAPVGRVWNETYWKNRV